MSLAEFIVFNRDGFLLLYPARFWIMVIMGMITMALTDDSIVFGIATIITVFALYKTYKCIMLIKSLPKDTVYYDLEIRENKIFGVETK